MTISAPLAIELCAHEPSSLLPLLSKYLPRSLPVVATIQENLSGPSSSTSDNSSGVIYATFPSGVIPLGPGNDGPGEGKVGIWGVVVQMKDPAYTHLRLFSSAEIDHASSSQHPAKREHVHLESEDRADEQELVIQDFISQFTHSIVRQWGPRLVLGSVDSRWNESVRNIVDSEEHVECTVFLAPTYVPIDQDSEDEKVKEKEMEGRVGRLGLEFDEAKDVDMDIIMSTCDVPRPREYYQSRAEHTTILRRTDGAREAVCWIMHHSDGAMGALYTLPAWRRKGLAEYVISRRRRDRHHLRQHSLEQSGSTKSQEGNREDPTLNAVPDLEFAQMDYCHVFRNNKASEALWAKLGWKAGWGVRWILNSEVAKFRGEVVLHRDNEKESSGLE